MSMTDPPVTRGTTSEVRGTATDTFPAPARHEVHETRRAWQTTELWLAILGVAALVIAYNEAERPTDLTLWRTCLLATVLGAAYIVSRGFAKAGSPDDEWRRPGRSPMHQR